MLFSSFIIKYDESFLTLCIVIYGRLYGQKYASFTVWSHITKNFSPESNRSHCEIDINHKIYNTKIKLPFDAKKVKRNRRETIAIFQEPDR